MFGPSLAIFGFLAGALALDNNCGSSVTWTVTQYAGEWTMIIVMLKIMKYFMNERNWHTAVCIYAVMMF